MTATIESLLRPGRLLLLALLAGTPAVQADAPVADGRRSLRQWTQEADAVVLAQFSTGMQVAQAAGGSGSQRFFRVRVIESLRGTLAGDVEFASRAHRDPRWRPGDVALLFFDRVDANGERFPFSSVQGAGDEWTLAPDTRNEVVSIAHGWAIAPPTLAGEDLRTVLLRELRSGDARLQSDALADLAQTACQTAVFPDGAAVVPFATAVTNGSLAAPHRLALARALQGCPGFDMAAALQRLTEESLPPGERTALMRAAGMAHDAALGEWLVGLLNDGDPMIRREAVAALGHPWHARATAPLGRVAATDTDSIAAAAVGALAAVGTPAAYALLTELARNERALVANTARSYLKQRPTPAH